MTRQQYIDYVKGSQEALRRFLTALCCGDTQWADDLAQDTYVKAYLASDGFRGDAKFTTWIYRIAYNTFVSQRRSMRPTCDIDDARDVAGDDNSDKALGYEDLYQALDRLSPQERTAIILFYMHDRSVKDIAAIVEASPEAVRQHLSRGRAHLRHFINR